MPAWVHNPMSDAAIIALGNAHWLKLDGSNANATIDIGSQDLTTTGTFNGVGVSEDGVNAFTIVRGSTNLDVSADVRLNQDLSTTTTPNFIGVIAGANGFRTTAP